MCSDLRARAKPSFPCPERVLPPPAPLQPISPTKPYWSHWAPVSPISPYGPINPYQPHGPCWPRSAPWGPTDLHQALHPPYIPTDPHGPHCSGFGQPHPNLAKPWSHLGATEPGRGGGSRSFWQGPGDAVGTGPSTGSSTDSSPPLCCPPQRPPHAGADGPGAVQGRDCFTGKGWERSRDHPSPAKQPSPRRGGVRPGAPNTAAHGLGKLLVPSRALLRFPLIAS